MLNKYQRVVMKPEETADKAEDIWTCTSVQRIGVYVIFCDKWLLSKIQYDIKDNNKTSMLSISG